MIKMTTKMASIPCPINVRDFEKIDCICLLLQQSWDQTQDDTAGDD